MAIDERARHQLFTKLEQKLGREEADTLMALLPPVGWADVATKHDLDLRFEAFEQRITAAWRKDLADQNHRLIMFGLALNSGLAVVVSGLAFAAARLF